MVSDEARVAHDNGGKSDKGARRDKDSASLLADVVILSEEMLSFARENNWDVVTSYETKRRELLRECFSQPVPDAQSELFSQALAAMLHMNEELIELLEAAKSNVAIKRTDVQYKMKSLSHYLDVQGD